MKIWVPLLVLLAGCGADPGVPGSDGGVGDGGDPCRAPAGCTSVLTGSTCRYSCLGLNPVPRVCLPLLDGGVAEVDGNGFPLTVIRSSGVPYAADLLTDRENCGRCGVRCAPGETCRRTSDVPTCGRP